jgi:hypothetical protein
MPGGKFKDRSAGDVADNYWLFSTARVTWEQLVGFRSRLKNEPTMPELFANKKKSRFKTTVFGGHLAHRSAFKGAMSPVEGEDSPVVYYTPGSSAFFTSLPPLLSLVFGSTSLVLVVILAFARARARRREHDLRRLLLGDGSFLEGLISKANATCLSTNTTVKTSHLETNCQILTLKKKETYRTWYLWQKNAPMWMVERVKEERKEDGGYGDSRRRDHWIVEWVDEGERTRLRPLACEAVTKKHESHYLIFLEEKT